VIDLAAIASARAAGQGAEADARALADRLVAAKAERRRLRDDLAVLPQRLAAIQGALAPARAHLDTARQAHDGLAAQRNVAEAGAEGADAEVTAAEQALQAAEAELEAAANDPGTTVSELAALRRDVQDAATAVQRASVRAASAHREVDKLTDRLAAARTELDAAESALEALTAEAAQVQARLDDANARRAAVEALPAELSGQIAAQQAGTAAAWRPWDDLLASARADIAEAEAALAAAASPAQAAAARAELERLRATLAAGDSPDDLVALLPTDVPLALLPVRLETRFERHDGGTDLLVRIYPDTVHVDAHEPELTADELSWGRRYLEQERAAGGGGAALEAWRLLAGRFGPRRAAWIAHAATAGEPAHRAETWTRAPTATVLPDRWIVLGYRDGERRFAALGRPIPDSLAVGPDPGAVDADSATAPLGTAAHWLVDFDRAVEQGMALRIALGAPDSGGFDRLLALGVHASADAAGGARRLAGLLDAHHYTDGLALLLPGTPTNNTESARSAWTAADGDAAASLAAERRAPLVAAGDGSDGDLLGRALGVGAAPFTHAAGADATTVAEERHMRVALWPVTWGYVLDQLVGGLSDAALAAGRAHLVDSVAAGGVLPSVRIGRQPYGVLPATSLELWRLLDPAGVDADLPPLLRSLAPAWRAAVLSVPRIAAGVDIGDVLAAALAMSPVSVAFAARDLSVPAPDDASFARRQAALAAVRALGLAQDPALARAVFDPGAAPLTGPLVAAKQSEVAPLPPAENYLDWLAAAGLDDLRDAAPPGGGNTLLFALLRHALLRAYTSSALRIVRARGLAAPGEGTEPGLGEESAPTPWDRLAAPLDGVTAPAQTLGVHLDAVRAVGTGASSPAAAQLGELLELQQSLLHLSGLPTARLARLAGGVLDLAAHRLDAWVTAHAVRRLGALRARQPQGLRLGGYGVLEDVRPAPDRAAASSGYIHAPSLGQAAAAAVLRSGHLAHRLDADAPLALDLTSRRVQLALHLLDGIRAGQPLGALLGYRVERGLHEHHPGLALERYVVALRGVAPLDATTQAEHDLSVALQRQSEVENLLGQKQQELDAATSTRQTTSDQLSTAQAELDAAQLGAEQVAANLEAAQLALKELLEEREPGLEGQIEAANQELRALVLSLDRANRLASDAAARAAELGGRLAVADSQAAALEQEITQLQSDLDDARSAVAAARTRLDEVRDREPPVSEAIRASNVADGLGLRRRWRTGTAEGRWDASTIPFGDPTAGLPPLASPDGQGINAELQALDDAVDALSDLLVAESVHQLVHGNPQRAGATVDALSRGEVPPPEVEVVRTPRSGTGVTHRLLVLLDPAAHTDGWPTDGTQVRAAVEPALEAWAANLLGPAARVRVRAGYTLPDGGHAHAEADLGVLGLSALDAVAMAPAGGPAGATEIELALLDHFARVRPAGVSDGAAPQLELERDPAWSAGDLGLTEFLELARAVRELLEGARALVARDLLPPGQAAGPGIDNADLAARAAVATGALEAVRSQLAAALGDGDSPVLRAALARAARLGVPAAPEGAAAALAELDRRARALSAADSDLARIAAVLGDGFRVLPRLQAAAGGELAASLAASAELQGGDELAAVTWLQRAAHVRAGAARLETALLYAQASGSPERLRLRVAQLPHQPGDRWAGLPAAPGTSIPGGRLSLVAQAGPVAPAAAVAGLVVDEWTEVVPDPTQVTGISFHVDQPSSRAPQAILLAVPPTEDHLWSLAALEATVLETLELARVRLVGSETLGRLSGTEAPRLGHYLPAVYLAAAPAAGTVTTDLGRVAAATPGGG